MQVGHLSDPDDLPGLAHFCEHSASSPASLSAPVRRRLTSTHPAVLFLGTEKHPDESEYKTYLSRNSGSSNAYTSLAEVRALPLFSASRCD